MIIEEFGSVRIESITGSELMMLDFHNDDEDVGAGIFVSIEDLESLQIVLSRFFKERTDE